MSYLTNLTSEDIETMPFPLQDILANSCYYPACRFDGRPIRYANGLGRDSEIINFIYVDFDVHLEQLIQEEDTFRGYEIVGVRNVTREDLVPHGWVPQFPPDFNREIYLQIVGNRVHSFCRWIVYQRKETFDENHGPQRISLLYISGEGMATYQALFRKNSMSPKLLVITDYGFGLNVTQFADPARPFYWIINNGDGIMPLTILFNGEDLKWPGYSLVGRWNIFTIWNYNN